MHFNLKQDDSLISIEDLKAFRLRKQKLESDKKARKYILEINKRYKKMSDQNKNKFLKNLNPFKNAA